MTWISIKERIAENKQIVQIKAEYPDMDSILGKAVFKIYDIDEYNEAWGWEIMEGYDCTLRPTHWREIPEFPNE